MLGPRRRSCRAPCWGPPRAPPLPPLAPELPPSVKATCEIPRHKKQKIKAPGPASTPAAAKTKRTTGAGTKNPNTLTCRELEARTAPMGLISVGGGGVLPASRLALLAVAVAFARSTPPPPPPPPQQPPSTSSFPCEEAPIEGKGPSEKPTRCIVQIDRFGASL
jgi:hypothetical protein